MARVFGTAPNVAISGGAEPLLSLVFVLAKVKETRGLELEEMK